MAKPLFLNQLLQLTEIMRPVVITCQFREIFNKIAHFGADRAENSEIAGFLTQAALCRTPYQILLGWAELD
jgi:hypothetical protein